MNIANILLLAFVFSFFSIESQAVDTKTHIEWCENDATFPICVGYFYAMLDNVTTFEKILNINVCVPPDMKVEKLVSIYIEYAKKNMKVVGSAHPSISTMAAWQDTFKCE